MTQSASSDKDMRIAFEHFMISGSNTVKDTRKEKKSTQKTDTTSIFETREGAALEKAEKKYWLILNAFQGTLERDWLEVDDNLEGVVSSIRNLRDRITMSSRFLSKLKNKTRKHQWEGCGYRHDDGCGLSVEDVGLALSHDLIQHEKMMAGARMLLASLSDAQDALARRLDELMLHHMDTVYLTQRAAVETSSSLSVVMSAVEELQDVFKSLALELYRKQLLIQNVLDAMSDDLLVRDDEDDEEATNDVEMDVKPRRAAEKCLRDWPRGSKSSHVNVEMLNGLLALGERGARRRA